MEHITVDQREHIMKTFCSLFPSLKGCANSSSQTVEVVFHGFAKTKGSGDIHLYGGCQSGRFDQTASSKVQPDGGWEFKANISTACDIFYTKYYSTSWGWEYLDSRGYRQLRTQLLKDGNAVVYTEFNDNKGEFCRQKILSLYNFVTTLIILISNPENNDFAVNHCYIGP